MTTPMGDYNYGSFERAGPGHRGGIAYGTGHAGIPQEGYGYQDRSRIGSGHGYSYDSRDQGYPGNSLPGREGQGVEYNNQVNRFFDHLKTIDQNRDDFEVYMRGLEAELDNEGVGYGAAGYPSRSGYEEPSRVGTGQTRQGYGVQNRDPYLSHDLNRGETGYRRDQFLTRRDQYDPRLSTGVTTGRYNPGDSYAGRYATFLPGYGGVPQNVGYHSINDPVGTYRQQVAPASLREFSPLKRDIGAGLSNVGARPEVSGFKVGPEKSIPTTNVAAIGGINRPYTGPGNATVGKPYGRPMTGGYQTYGNGFVGTGLPRFANTGSFIAEGPGGTYLPPKNRGYVHNLYANPYFIDNLGGLPDSVSGDLEASLMEHELRPNTGDYHFRKPTLLKSRSATSLPGSRHESPVKNFSATGSLAPGEESRMNRSFSASRRDHTPSKKTTLHESQFIRSQLHDKLEGRAYTEGQ
eukprot:CAMPEP_0114989408 /NCGR_PEP_ID=MMETSP0216-20121206/10181_1 /TAXON_ID=223996 /ORGANISM="Protocruzia adherens, Strain Boccale" /LENGTH=463 /DNA_ID=CAMNT_0002352383 /DNA_START=58 /DNA_END=1449 /DNA_ORIENTATION=+